MAKVLTKYMRRIKTNLKRKIPLYVKKEMDQFYRNPLTSAEKAEIKSLDFQCMDWVDMNDGSKIKNKTTLDEDEEEIVNREYTIKAFGVTKAGQSVCLNIRNYRPFLYVRVPSEWSKQKCSLFYNSLKTKLKVAKHFNTCLISHEVLQKKDFMGFRNGEKNTFIKLIFNNSEALNHYKYKVTKLQFLQNFKPEELKTLKTYEAKLDHIIRFYHIRDVKPCGFVHVENIKFGSSLSSCQLDISADWQDVSPLHSEKGNAPILQASYDIEVYSHDNSFPNPKVKENVVTQIATCFKRYGDSDFLVKHIITLKKCGPIVAKEGDPFIVVESYDTEREVLLAWAKLVRNMDPDVLLQFNGDSFDSQYINQRSVQTKCSSEFLSEVSRLKKVPGSMKADTFASSAFGKSEYYRMIIPGRIHFDLLIWFTRELKETSYKLDDLSEKYIGQNKNHMPVNEMFRLFREGQPDQIKVLAEYCIQDTLLPQLLSDRFHILQNQISMANVSMVPFKYLIFKGQQIKAYSQILQKTHQLGFVVPDVEYAQAQVVTSADGEEAAGTSFKGATVLQPITGAFFEPVTCLDFASLYPSIIRSHNLCYTSIVLPQDEEKYGNIEGVEYSVFEWNDDDAKADDDKSGTGYHKYKFAKNVDTVIPLILAELAESRNGAKKLLKQEKDPFTKVVYDKLQLAYKLSMNSMYGFLAAHMVPCKPIAATVTTVGRRMIRDTKQYVEDNYDASVVIYGDSVTADTPVTLRDPSTSKIKVMAISDLNDSWQKYPHPFKVDGVITHNHNKEQQNGSVPFQVWSDQGWVGIKRVIRHKTRKRIYRVGTSNGFIDVTEDHSLIDSNGNLLKPGDCQVGTKLLHSFPGKV